MIAGCFAFIGSAAIPYCNQLGVLVLNDNSCTIEHRFFLYSSWILGASIFALALGITYSGESGVLTSGKMLMLGLLAYGAIPFALLLTLNLAGVPWAAWSTGILLIYYLIASFTVLPVLFVRIWAQDEPKRLSLK